MRTVLVYLFYLVVAGIVATIFKFAMGLIMAIPLGVIALIKKGDIESLIEVHPRLIYFIGVMNHTLASIIYSYVILYSTAIYADRYGGNFWFYAIVSVIWSLSMFSGLSSFHGIAFFTCTIGLILMWNGFWFAPVLIGLLSAIISIAYHFGRIQTAIDIDNGYKG